MSVKTGRRVALVTGSTSGIGAEIARRLAREGFAIILNSRTSEGEGKALAATLEDACYIRADLSLESERFGLIAQALTWQGRLDVLVNNAGISATIPHQELANATPKIWHDLYEVDVVAPFQLVAAAETALRESSTPAVPSCVVNITSHAGVRPKGASIPYAAAKAALNHATRLLALSLAPIIRVNAIAPGLVDTPLTADWTDAQELWRSRAPMRRAARPEDIAECASFFVKSAYVTGEVMIADGGLNLT